MKKKILFSIIAALLCIVAITLYPYDRPQHENLAVELAYRINKTNTHKKEGTTHTEHETLTRQVVLSDNHLILREGEHERIYDFLNKEITVINHKKSHFYRIPLHATIDFRVMEKRNREILARVISDAGKLPKGFTPFELEMVFNLGEAETANILVEDNQENYVFAHNSEQIAIYQPGRKLDERYHKSFEKFLIYGHHIHPFIRQHIHRSGRLYQTLSFRHYPFERVEETHELISAKHTREYQLSAPETYTEIYHLQSEELNSIYHEAWHRPLHLSKEKYEEEHHRLFDQKRYIEAFLAYWEYHLTYGTGLGNVLKTYEALAKENEEVRLFWNAVSAKDPESAARAVKALNFYLSQGLEYGYILDFILHEKYHFLGKKKHEEAHLTIALQHNPHLTAFYIYTGKDAREAFLTEEAWLTLRLAEHLSPEHPDLKALSKFKEKLEQEHPDYF